ncbi:hypothetical protein ACIBF1_37515 [Spirillospora sp. NPDC050679]
MTTPEESAPKTDDTDQVLSDSAPADPKKPDDRTQMAQQLEEAMSEAGVSREDLTSE